MKKTWFVLTFFFLIIFPYKASATSGACSYHNGVNCSVGSDIYGYAVCNDGFHSSVLFSQMSECKISPCEYLKPNYELYLCHYWSDYDYYQQIYQENLQEYQTNLKEMDGQLMSRGLYGSPETSKYMPSDSEVKYSNSQLNSCKESINNYEDSLNSYNKCLDDETKREVTVWQDQQQLLIIQKQAADEALKQKQINEELQKNQQEAEMTNNKIQLCKSENALYNFFTDACVCDTGYSFKNSICVKNEIPKPIIVQPIKATSIKAIIKKSIVKKIIAPAKKKVLKSDIIK